MTDLEAYELSLYETVAVIKKSDAALVELVKHSLDNKEYIKKTYYSDKREVFRALSNIASDHLVSVKAVFFSSETMVIEEYIEGTLLSELLSRNENIRARLVIDQLIQALIKLHEKNIIHRDIKPSNIMIRPDGSAVLIDYGIARLYDKSREEDTELYGTVGYAPPEQYGYSQSDFKSDIYALGKTIEKISETQSVPSAYLKVAKRCCAFDPAARFQSVQDVKKALDKSSKSFKVILGVGAFCAMLAIGMIVIGIAVTGVLVNNKPDNNEVVETDYSSRDAVSDEGESKEEAKEEYPEEVPVDVDEAPVMEEVWYQSKLVKLMSFSGEILILPITEQEETFNVDLGDGVVSIQAFMRGKEAIVTLDGERFVFDASSLKECLDGEHFASELMLYDWDQNGIAEIIPLCGRVIYYEEEDGAQPQEEIGWCIYKNEDGKYVTAEGHMETAIDAFSIFDPSPDSIYGMNFVRFVLENGEIKQID